MLSNRDGTFQPTIQIGDHTAIQTMLITVIDSLQSQILTTMGKWILLPQRMLLSDPTNDLNTGVWREKADELQHAQLGN